MAKKSSKPVLTARRLKSQAVMKCANKSQIGELDMDTLFACLNSIKASRERIKFTHFTAPLVKDRVTEVAALDGFKIYRAKRWVLPRRPVFFLVYFPDKTDLVVSRASFKGTIQAWAKRQWKVWKQSIPLGEDKIFGGDTRRKRLRADDPSLLD